MTFALPIDLSSLPPYWVVAPLSAVTRESRVRNAGIRERNLLSLSYGRIIEKDIDSTDGLRPQSFETYQIVNPGMTILRLTDLQNDQRSLRSGLVPVRGIITSAYAAVEPTGFDSRFFSYLMRAYDSRKVFYSLGGGVRQSIKYCDIRRLPVPQPPPAEQFAIADFLDRETAQIDAMIEAQRELVERLEEHRSALLTEALTVEQADTSGSRLKHYVRSVRQGWSPQCQPFPRNDIEEWAVLRTGCVNRGTFNPADNKVLPGDLQPRPETVVRRGEVILSRANTRELLASAAVVEDDYPRLMLSDKLYSLELHPNANPWYVASLLRTRRLRDSIELAAGGASHSMQNISQFDILNLPVSLPPRDCQDAVVRELQRRTQRLDQMVEAANESIALMQERRSALITAAVTGRIDPLTGRESIPTPQEL